MKVPAEVQDVTEIPRLPEGALDWLVETYGDDDLGLPSLERLGYDPAEIMNRTKSGIDFTGGEDAGLKLLQHMMARAKWVATFEKPKTSPNALTVDTTGLSPYVKHGCVSPRRFYHELSKVYAKHNPKECSKPPVSLHGQLMWREYNYLVGYTTPNFDRMVDNPLARQIPWDSTPELLEAWKNARTGYPFIDAIMTQLRETGWIHHLARHAVACFLTRGDLWQSWEEGAAHFEEYLIDADWSINNFNWQWLSCTAHFYQYFRCYSPIAFGKKTDPNGHYIRKWLPQFKKWPAKYIYEPWEAPLTLQQATGVIIGKDYPKPIVDHKKISKENMGLMKEAYDAQKNGLPMPEPPQHEFDVKEPSSKRQKR
jgi:cryptochrome